jgi:hypothetical protein
VGGGLTVIGSAEVGSPFMATNTNTIHESRTKISIREKFILAKIFKFSIEIFLLSLVTLSYNKLNMRIVSNHRSFYSKNF